MISSQALRGRQKTLLRNYKELANAGNTKEIAELIPRFLDNFENEEEINSYIGIDTSYYPIFFDNIFRSIGFQLFAGKLPSVSGVKPRYRTLPHFIAVDSKRIIMFGSNPQSLFAEIADVQPTSPLPIIGLCYSTWSRVQKRKIDDWEIENKQIATALGLSFLSLDSSILEKGTKLSSHYHNNKARKLATNLGLPEMLSLSVDNMGVYGTFQASRLSWPFGIRNFTTMCNDSLKRGHELDKGKLTKTSPIEALSDTESFFKNLNELDLISKTKKNNFDIGNAGTDLIKQKIVSTPQEAILYNFSVNFRKEVKEGFASILQQLNIGKQKSYHKPELYIDEIDSFSKVKKISSSMVKEKMLSEDFIQTRLEKILGESYHKKDWSGESSDLYTSYLTINKKRYRAAFLLKGSGTKGKLTIAKCGKNGDQIQRLFKCPADIFVIQHVTEIDEAVIEEAKQKTMTLRSTNPKVQFCIINGIDIQRILLAYS